MKPGRSQRRGRALKRRSVAERQMMLLAGTAMSAPLPAMRDVPEAELGAFPWWKKR